jgi:hypothetical protein
MKKGQYERHIAAQDYCFNDYKDEYLNYGHTEPLAKLVREQPILSQKFKDFIAEIIEGKSKLPTKREKVDDKQAERNINIIKSVHYFKGMGFPIRNHTAEIDACTLVAKKFHKSVDGIYKDIFKKPKRWYLDANFEADYKIDEELARRRGEEILRLNNGNRPIQTEIQELEEKFRILELDKWYKGLEFNADDFTICKGKDTIVEVMVMKLNGGHKSSLKEKNEVSKLAFNIKDQLNSN